MADDLSLLFRLRGDNSQLKSTVADTRAAVASLKQTLGPELSQTLSGTSKVISEIGENINAFVGQRIPLVGGAFLRVTSNLKGFNDELKKGGPNTAALSSQIDAIAKSSGKTSTEVARFLTTFTRLEGQATRNDAAFKFFGGSVDLIGNKTAKFVPELEKAAGSLAAAGGEAGAAGGAIASMAGPIGIAVLAVAALAAGAVVAGRELFDLTKQAAEFQGRMFDLAQQTGLAVKTLSALEVVAKTTGGELGSITQAIVLFQRKLDDAQDPLSKTSEQFRKLGVDTSDTETSLRSAFAALAAMPEGFAQTNAAAELFGARGGKQVLAILKETNGDLDSTIKRLDELGILISDDAARAADIFNDQLAIVEFQLRALTAAAAEDLIPVMLELIKAFGGVLSSIRPVISILGTLTANALEPAAKVIKDVSVVVRLLSGDYKALAEAIKEARDAQNIEPLKVPEIRPVPLPGVPSALQVSTEAVTSAEAVLAETKRRAAQTNQALDEMFHRGRVNRQRETEDVITTNKRILEAERSRIDAQLTLKEQEIAALDDAARKRGESNIRDSEQFRAISAQVSKLQQERLDKESEFEVTSRALRAKAAQERAQSLRSQIQNESDILVKEFDRTIKDIEAQIKRGSQAEETGLTIIDQLEQQKIDARINTLQKQKETGFLTIQEQKDLNAELQQLQQEKDGLDDEQRARRLQREIDAAARNRDILTANLDALIQLEQIAGARRVSTLKSLADQRVITEEDAASRILKIRLDLIDDELAATQAKLTTAKSITDKDERLRAQTELNNQIKILKAQRVTIDADGNRDIDEKRQEDLQNERRYADDLEDIKERIRDIERDAAEEVIRLMRLHFANRKDIIRAQRDLDLQEEDDRHRRATNSLNEQRQEVDDEIRVLERHLESLKVGTTEEIEEHDRLTESLEKLRIKRAELEAQQQAENTKSATRKRRTTDEADADLEREDPISTRSLFGDSFKEDFEAFKQAAIDAGEPINDLNASLKALAQSSAEAFAQMSADTENFGSFAAEAFGTLAQGIGQIVESYVLLGETGPAALRKLLAQVLAHLAAEAAVKAIFELAEGFAMLFVNPAAAGAHFTAAAIYGSVAGVAAVAGRSVAGDLFKSKSSGAGSGSSSSSGNGEVNPLNPLTLTRNSGQGGTPQIPPQIQPQRVRVEIAIKDSELKKVFTAHVVDDVNNNGPIRNVLAGDGNISGR